MKPSTETQRTFKMVACINPSIQKIAEGAIALLTDYHIIIPLVPQGLSTWAEGRSTKAGQISFVRKKEGEYI